MNKVEERAQNPLTPFKIKAVVSQTGLNPATIRAWERRYGFPEPRRSGGGHRQYSQQDIDALNWLVKRQEEGLSISSAIELWQDAIRRGEDPLREEISSSMDQLNYQLPPIEGDQIDQLREAWITACLAFDRNNAEQILAHAFALFPPEVVVSELLQKGLAEIGNGWHQGTVTVQQEHFTSYLSMQRLEMLIAGMSQPSRPERIIVASAPGDYHAISPTLLTYLLRRRGWDVVYLGPDVPASKLEETIEKLQPQMVVMSAQLLTAAANLKDVAQITGSFGIPLAYGGLAFNNNKRLTEYIPGFYLGESLEEAVGKLLELFKHKLPETPPGILSESALEALEQFRQRRVMIEALVWGVFVAQSNDTHDLPQVNNDFAQLIEAALKIGDINLLASDLEWIRQQLMSYRLSRSWLGDYIKVYHQAASDHLTGPAKMVSAWLERVIESNQG